MRYVMTFATKTAGYRCHAEGCDAACDTRHTNVLPDVFLSIADARAYADADERQKGGERANFKACKCTRT